MRSKHLEIWLIISLSRCLSSRICTLDNKTLFIKIPYCTHAAHSVYNAVYKSKAAYGKHLKHLACDITVMWYFWFNRHSQQNSITMLCGAAKPATQFRFFEKIHCQILNFLFMKLALVFHTQLYDSQSLSLIRMRRMFWMSKENMENKGVHALKTINLE